MARETHDLGRLYCHGMRYPAGRWPRLDIGTSHEVEEPWRIGRCVVVRIPLTRAAAVIGWWGRGRTIDEVRLAELDNNDVSEPVTPETVRAWQAPPVPETNVNPFMVRRAR